MLIVFNESEVISFVSVDSENTFMQKYNYLCSIHHNAIIRIRKKRIRSKCFCDAVKCFLLRNAKKKSRYNRDTKTNVQISAKHDEF